MPSIASHKHIRAEQRRFRREQTGQSWSVKDLPQYYYHTNFLNIIDEIQKRYDTLLSETEQEFLQTFRTLPFYAECIYIRLCARKGHIFHIDKVSNPQFRTVFEQEQLGRLLCPRISNLKRQSLRALIFSNYTYTLIW